MLETFSLTGNNSTKCVKLEIVITFNHKAIVHFQFEEFI